ncbi:ROK family protein [Paenibacillus sp. y28]|uniref:ROK family protein n=1 Tax=Paenibacillus sp. y28 TaxID=3129110 RepID=UPI0030177CEF
MDKLDLHIPGGKAKQIYAFIRKGGIVSKIELIELSGLTVSTLTRILDELQANRLIEECGYGESTGGRRPILYRTNAQYGYALGLDISRSRSRLIVCDMHMNTLDAVEWMMDEQMSPQVFFKSVTEKIHALLDKLSIPAASLIGMGVGAVGPLDRKNGMILEPLYFSASGWRNVPICDFFRQQLQIPVLLDNGANTALLAECWAQSLQDVQNLLYVRAGVGLRSSIMFGGKIVYGAVDTEGAIGQMIVQATGVAHRGRQNSFGCLESYVSIYAMEQQAQSALKLGRKSILLELAGGPEEVRFSHLLEALRLDDPLATHIFTEAGLYFGIGLANLLNTLHPEQVIVGGPLVSSNELFYDTAIQTALEHTYYYPSYKVVFNRGLLSEGAQALGAAAMVLEALSGMQ